MEAERKRLKGGAWYELERGWLDAADADRLRDAVRAESAWEERAIVVFGREVMQPRLVAWAGELPYRYSGQQLPPRPPEPGTAELLRRVREATGVPFNHVVLNLYRDGADHVAWHADNEGELGHDPVIASVSLGATRRFELQARWKRSLRRSMSLPHGSLLVMGGAMQHSWRHRVPKQGHVTDERINLTFRLLRGPPGWRASEPSPHDRRPRR